MPAPPRWHHVGPIAIIPSAKRTGFESHWAEIGPMKAAGQAMLEKICVQFGEGLRKKMAGFGLSDVEVSTRTFWRAIGLVQAGATPGRDRMFMEMVATAAVRW